MKIAIISDTHDNLATLNQALDWLNRKNVEIIIHCGDVSTTATLENLINRFSGPIYLVLGNTDNLILTRKNNVKIWEEKGEIVIENKKIVFTHFPKKALELAQNIKPDLVFYGHTHKPWIKSIGHTKLVNPGTLAGLFYKATFAVYDTLTDKLELKILEQL